MPGSDTCAVHGSMAAREEKQRRLASIDDIIADLLAKQERLSALLDGVEDLTAAARLFALHGQNASRLGRLLRDRQVLEAASADGLLEAFNLALDELSRELGIEL